MPMKPAANDSGLSLSYLNAQRMKLPNAPGLIGRGQDNLGAGALAANRLQLQERFPDLGCLPQKAVLGLRM